MTQTALRNPPSQRRGSEPTPLWQVESFVEKWSHADFMRHAPENKKAELVDGDFYVMPPPFYVHERLQVFLITVLTIFVNRFDLGQILGSRTAVYISATDTYEPDILFVRRGREHIITQHELVEAPDLVVEILSKGTAHLDRGKKLQGYSAAGVRELWLIDPYGLSGTQFFQRHGDALIEVAPVEGFINSVTLPSFHLDTACLWPDDSGNLPNPIDVLRELGALG